MNEYILKLRKVNLRWLTALIFVVSIILTVVITLKTGDMSGFTIIIGITGIIIYIALAVHAIEEDNKALIVSYILLVAVFVGIINATNQFGNYLASQEFSNDFTSDIFLGTNNVETQIAAMLIKNAPMTLFTSICCLTAFIYGVFYVRKKYTLVWILFTIGFAISSYQAYLLVSGGMQNWDTYSGLGSAMNLLSFVAIVSLLVVGGKNQKETTVDSERKTIKPVEVIKKEEPKQKSLSEQLFQLKELLDSGILTQEEFDNEKKKILNS